MRFLLDENADARLADHLRRLGHDVTTIIVDYARSIGDPQILAIAQREGRILITNDRDFGELIVGHVQPHAGVIYFRLSTTSLDATIERLEHVLSHYSDRLDQLACCH